MSKNRYIDLEGTFNFRDIGGYTTDSGKQVKYGKHYRSDELSNLTSNDIEIFKSLGIKTIIDYRNDKERYNNEDVKIENVEIYYLDPVADIAALASSDKDEKVSDTYDFSHLTAKKAKELMTNQNVTFVHDDKSKEAYKKMFELMLDDEKDPIVQHCRGGKDRTGYGVALILGVLGVSKEDIIYDYMLTNYYKKDKNETSLAKLLEETNNPDLVQAVRYFKEANLDFINTALNEIETNYGTIENYVIKELGISKSKIERLKEQYTE